MFKLVYDSAARVVAHERRDPRYALSVPGYRWMVDLVRAALDDGRHGTGLHLGRLNGVRLSWSRALGLADVHYDHLHLGVTLVVPDDGHAAPLRDRMAASLFATKVRLLGDDPACHAPTAYRHVELTRSPLSVAVRLPPASDGTPLTELCDVAEEIFYVAFCEHAETVTITHPRLRGTEN